MSRIIVRVTQRSVPVDAGVLERDLQEILRILQYDGWGVSLWVTTDATIRTYNRDFRHVDKATDVLSFPYWPDLKAGLRARARSVEDQELGDLIISAPYVVRAARELKVTFAWRMRVLLVHGMCHLLGYDHIDDGDWRRMRAKEAYILKALQKKYPMAKQDDTTA